MRACVNGVRACVNGRSKRFRLDHKSGLFAEGVEGIGDLAVVQRMSCAQLCTNHLQEEQEAALHRCPYAIRQVPFAKGTCRIADGQEEEEEAEEEEEWRRSAPTPALTLGGRR